MAETVVSLAGQHALPKFLEVVNMLRGLKKEIEDIKNELESFQHFINDADKVAEAEQDDGKRFTNKKRVKRLREAVFSMEDIIDLYDIYEDKQPGDPGCAALHCEAVDYIKSLIFRIQIVFKIQEVKSLVKELKENYCLQSKLPLEQRPISSTGNQNVPRHNLRMAPLYAEEAEVVGFDGPRDILKDWLIEGRVERTVIFVVGMGGLGKTTLAKLVYDNMEVYARFDCQAWITVSQSYTAEGLLREMLDMLCNEKVKDPAPNFETLTRKLRNGLRNKRYVVVFDDVWNTSFWNDIQFALIDNKNGSRILITTRVAQVAHFCMKDSLIQVQVHNLEPLSKEKSLELLCKKAFGYGFDGCCPKEYKDVGLEIVGKCQCLPLAIVAIGGLLYSKCKSAAEWKRFSQNLSLELERNSELSSISQILCLSYDDLPYNLRSCLLYFGMYPEDYKVKSKRLIRQWIAEGFVKQVTGETLEEVAQQYLAELINRSLVQLSSFTIDGKVRGCHVHDSIHEMILGKIKDTVFCHCIPERNQLVSSGILRRLTIATGSTDLIGSIERSHVRSILIFTKRQLSENFISEILAKYMPLRVLDFEYAGLSHLPENLGNLIHLKYLSLRYTQVETLPKSIGELQNLETLDIRHTNVFEIPKEISKLRKLRHLLANRISSIAVKDGLGGMTSLQKIRLLEIDHDGVVIRELGKLKQLRDLRIINLRGEHSNTLCSSINEMQFLKTLVIMTEDGYGVNHLIDLHTVSSLSTLRKLVLQGNLNELPNWIPRLQDLVKLSLKSSKLTNDPLNSLKDMPNLLFLSLDSHAYEGQTLYFQKGGFQKLKELELNQLNNLNSIVMDKGTLLSLKKLHLYRISKLKEVPRGIQHLEKLEDLFLWGVSTRVKQSIDPNGGQEHWMIQHVPHISIIDLVTVLTMDNRGY